MASTYEKGTKKRVAVADGEVMGGAERMEVTTPTTETSSPVFLDADIVIITVTPGSGGTAKAQATWSHAMDVKNGNARWFDWDMGAVSAAAVQELRKATAVRLVNVSGANSAVMEIAQ